MQFHLRQAAAALLFLLLFLAAEVARAAPVARLVRDIDATSYAGSSSPRQFVGLRSGSAFTAHQDRELWIVDGPEDIYHLALERQEIRQLRDNLYAARTASGGWTLWTAEGFPYYSAVQRSRTPLFHLGPVHTTGFWSPWIFEADAGKGRGLWAVGSEDGWSEVARPLPLADGRLLRDFTAWSGSSYFVARHRTMGSALWVTGSPPGTVPVWAPAPGQTVPLSIVGALPAGLLLAVSGGEPELWLSDGTRRGTRPLTQLVRGPRAATLGEGSVVAGRAFFLADDGRHGQQLWTSDGTAGGTRRLTRFASASPFAAGPLGLVAVEGRWIFFADDGVHGRKPWVSDGTAAGTRLLGDLCPGACASAGTLLPTVPADVDSGRPARALFTAVAPDGGVELWASDGIGAAPVGDLGDLCHGACADAVADPVLTYLADYFVEQVVFTAATGEGSRALWASDGTVEGTRRLTPPGVTGVTGLITQDCFTAADAEFGEELWCTGGTPESTGLALDLDQLQDSGSHPRFLGAAGDRAVLTAFAPPFARQLWSSDGTSAGTARIPVLAKDPSGFSVPAVSLPERIVFVAVGRGSANSALWATDGTAAGTVPVTPPGVDASGYPASYRVGVEAFFLAYDAEHGLELWASAGTPSTTRLVADLAPGPASMYIEDPLLATVRGELLFRRHDDDDHLWLSDGTAAGTRRLLDAYPFLAALDRYTGVAPAEFAGRLYFTSFEEGSGDPQLWVSDWTPEGTRVLTLSDIASVTRFRVAGPHLFLQGIAGDASAGLWASDGTPEGTVRLPLEPGFGDGELAALTFADQLLVEDRAGLLWVSDGSLAGTRNLRDPEGNAVYSATAGGAVLGDQLVFSGSYSLSPCYVWDGIGDAVSVLAGVLCSGSFLQAGPRAFFSGFTPGTGVELWVVEER
jgi:ELWxxDGT repeat protein